MLRLNMEESENSKIRQRTKNGENCGQKTTESAKKGANGGNSRRLISWTVLFLIGTFAVGFFIYRTRETPPKNYQREIGRECDDGTAKCIAITDTSEDFGKTWVRDMHYVDKTTTDIKKMMINVGAEAILKCATNDASSDQCEPDHDQLSLPYTITMGLMPFVIGTLHHPSQTQQNAQSALIVGLGGGTLDMFFHKKMPNLNITIYELDPKVVRMAHKWFGTVEDSTRRTIIEDGIIGIEKAAENGEQFDLIALDACEMFAELICPVPIFATENALKNIKAILKPTGAFVVNVLTSDDKEEQNYIAEHKRNFLRFFPTCLHMMFDTEMSHVFICLLTEINVSEHKNFSEKWEKKRKELTEEFGFGEKLSKYRIQ